MEKGEDKNEDGAPLRTWFVGNQDWSHLQNQLAVVENDEERSERCALAARLLSKANLSPNAAYLEHFGLRAIHCGLVAECFRPRVSVLVDVSLSDNELGDAGVEPLLRVLLDAPRLRVLKLRRTQLRTEDTPSLFILIQNSPTLTLLDVSDNPGNPDFGARLGAALLTNSSLESLSVDSVPLGAPMILRSLWKHPRLRYLSMNRCADTLGHLTVQDIAALLKTNGVLRVFAMDRVPCRSADLVPILEALYDNTSLTQLFLGPAKDTEPRMDPQTYAVLRDTISRLLDHNVTLQMLPLESHEATRQIRWNTQRRESRLQRAQAAYVAVESLRRFQRSPVLKLIGRDIMRLVGVFIMATKRCREWEGPDLRPQYDFSRPFYGHRSVVVADQQARKPTAYQEEKRRRLADAQPLDINGPWRRAPGGEWEWWGHTPKRINGAFEDDGDVW
jgi:hypothetical protein